MTLNKIFIITLISVFCHYAEAQESQAIHLKQNHVIVLKVDTLNSTSEFLIRTTLKCANKTLLLVNRFSNASERNENFFDLKNYLGLEVIYKRKAIVDFKGFKKELCDYSTPFYEDFKENDVDNETGYRYLAIDRNEYLLLPGYFNKCNGSFCNSGVLLVLHFRDGSLNKGYLIGIDKSQYNLSKITLRRKGNWAEVKLLKDNKRNIILILKNEIELVRKSNKKLSQLGLYCIK